MKKLHLVFVLFVSAFSAVFTQSAYPEMDNEITTFLKDGGWCWYEDPRAVINNGKLVIGAVSGVTGDIRVGVYDLQRNKHLGAVVLHKEFERDDHDSPVFYARPDGSLLAMWAQHGHEKYHYYNISSSSDYLNWGERKLIEHDFEIPEGNHWSGVTYMNLYTVEKQGLLYNFFRDGLNRNPTFITSSNQGKSWDDRTHFIVDEVEGKNRPYVRYMQLNSNSIGVSFTDAHPRNFGNSVYYVSFDGTSFFKANGEKIGDIAQGPLKPSSAEKIYKGSESMDKSDGYESVPNSAWTCDIERDRKERPYLGYTLYLNNKDIRFRLANWTGKKWVDREIAFAGPGLYDRESSYSGLMALDPEKPENIFISTPVNPNTGVLAGGPHEIYFGKVKSKKNTDSIKWKQITHNSKHKNIRPIIVSGEGYKVLLWLNGPWHTYTDFASDVVGIVLQRPK